VARVRQVIGGSPRTPPAAQTVDVTAPTDGGETGG
jgi:hypothetical protein